MPSLIVQGAQWTSPIAPAPIGVMTRRRQAECRGMTLAVRNERAMREVPSALGQALSVRPQPPVLTIEYDRPVARRADPGTLGRPAVRVLRRVVTTASACRTSRRDFYYSRQAHQRKSVSAERSVRLASAVVERDVPKAADLWQPAARSAY